jgi:hypothetical protein
MHTFAAKHVHLLEARWAQAGVALLPIVPVSPYSGSATQPPRLRQNLQ